MPAPQKRTAQTGATRRGHYRAIPGTNLAVDAVSVSGGGGGTPAITQLTGDVTAGPGSGSQVATIAANAVDNTKLRDSAALSVIGRSANSIGDPADIATAADGDVLRRAGTALGFGAIATVAITDAAVTLAKLANLVTQTLIGRNTGSTGVPEAVTLSQLLDWISGSVAQGDLLVRGASSWSRLAAPNPGLFLGGNGAGVLSYQTPFGVASPFYAANQFQWNALSPTLVTGVGIQSPGTATGAQAPAGGTFSDAYYIQFLETTTLNSNAALVGTTGTGIGPLNFLFDFDIIFVIRTDATAVTSTRFWCGVLSGSPGATDTLASNGVAFRYSTAAGDAGFVGVTYDGTQAVTASVASIAANTRYALRIRKVGGTVFFSVNGGTEVSTSTHVPTNDIFRVPTIAILNPTGGAGTARSFYFSRMFCNYGT